VLLCGGWWLSATGETKPAGRTLATSTVAARTAQPRTLTTAGLGPSLQGQLQQLLSQAPLVPGSRLPGPPVVSDLQIPPHGTVCPVAAGGFCSLAPCVQFAAGGDASPGRNAVIEDTLVGPGVLGRTLAAPSIRQAPQLGGSGCQRHRGPSQTLRVSGA
jgi:hypothetical protein